MALQRRSTGRLFCKWKGQAMYFDLLQSDTVPLDTA
jgi:uncharacterized protein (DUF427 family)